MSHLLLQLDPGDENVVVVFQPFLRQLEEIDDTDEIEDVDDAGGKDVCVIALGIDEETRRKNVKLYKRFNQERLKRKVFLTLLVVSLIINLGFL